MKTTWIQSNKWKGVRWRLHPTRKHGVQFDRYYALRYQVDGERHEEALGWASDAENWTEEKAALKLAELKKAIKSGTGPTRLSEERRLAKEKREAAEAERKRQEEERLQQERDCITVAQFFEQTYFPQCQADKKQGSWRTEELLFRNWINPVIGTKPLKDVSPIHLEKIKSNMAKAGRTPRTAHYCLAVVRQIFNTAKRLSYFADDNPVSKVKKPTADNRRVRFLSHEEAKTLLDALKARSQRLHDITLVSLHCGLRAGEIFGLEWRDLDLERRQILVRDGKNSMGGRSRTAYMTDEVRQMFAWRSALDRRQDLVFPNTRGGRIETISNAFDEVIKSLGWNDGISDRRHRVVFHTCRHTFASWLVEAGTDLYTVKELLGHQSISMTERYSHLGANTLRRAVSVLESAIREGGKVVSLAEARGTVNE